MANPLPSEVTPPGPTSSSSTPAAMTQEQKPAQQQPAQSSTDAKEVNGDAKPAKQQQQQKQQEKTKDAPADENTEKLSPAELKKRAKAEKAARRAKVKAEREQAAAAGEQQGQAAQAAKKGQAGGGKDAAGAAQKGQKNAAVPRRGSAQAGAAATEKKEDKNVAVFGHLYGHPRRTTIAGAAKEVHPAVLALGLQIRDYVICGSSARCVATLLAFKRVRDIVTLLIRTKKAVLLLIWCW